MAKTGKKKQTKSSNAQKLKDIPPPITGQHKPNFAEFEGIPFQEFCRDILAEDPVVSTCDQYAKRGAKTGDFGVDVYASLKVDDGVIVAQCKNKKSVTALMIRTWSSDFFEHWDSHWRDKAVRKFILMVGCDLQATAIVDELWRQKKRFAEHSIEYEWWSNSTILTKLKPHPYIVNRYFGSNASYWVDFICGPQPIVQASESVTVSKALIAQLSQATQALSKQADALLQQAIGLWKEGRISEADDVVSELRNNSIQWDALDSQVKANVVALQGKLALERFDLQRARECALESKALGEYSSTAHLLAVIALNIGDLTEASNQIESCSGIQADFLKVSIFLQSGKGESALKILTDIHAKEPKNADALRLMALSTLVEGNVSQALAFADEALSLQPNWKYARLTSGIVRYYAALSPTQIPKIIPALPDSVDWSLVKYSDEARQRLSESEVAFRSLVASAAGDEEKHQLEGWLFATLANNLARQTEAEEECKRLAGQEGTSTFAIVWSIARNYRVDSEHIKSDLERKCLQNDPSTEQILNLVFLLIKDRKFVDAGELLDKFRAGFIERQLESVWFGWRAQVFLLLGKVQEAADLYGGIDGIPTEFLPLIKNNIDRKRYLSKVEVGSLQGRQLLNACIAYSLVGDWGKIASVAHKLINEVQTEIAIRLVAEALLRTSQFESCLKILNENATLFNGHILPTDLQSFQVKCLQELGQLNEAIAQAERISNESPNTQTLLNYSRLLIQAGDMKLVSSVAQRLLRQSDLTAVQAIRMAEVILIDDPETARRLWKRAVDQRLKGDYVSRAVILGYHLGMESDSRYAACHARLQQIAQSGSKIIRSVSLDDVVVAVRRQREANQKKLESYREGNAPAHFLYELPQIYHSISPNGDIGPSLNQFHVFAMHEDRQFATGFPSTKPTWRLNLDISAILLAEEFEFLDAVLESHEYIRVPSETIPVLLNYRHQLQPLPERRLANILTVTAAIADNRLATFALGFREDEPAENLSVAEKAHVNTARVMQYVEAEGGWFIDFAVEGDAELGSFPSSRKLNARDVLDSLFGFTALSEGLFNSAKTLLPEGGQSANIPLGSKLFMPGAMIQTFAVAGILEFVLNHFLVLIPKDDVEIMLQDLRRHEATVNLQEWLTGLIERLSSNIQQNKIHVLPGRSASVPDEFPSAETLISLLQFSPAQGDVIWIDDRHCNGHFHQGNGAPIASSWEVLKALTTGEFGKERYFRTLLKMRQANVRYLPIEAEEIAYHLKQAPVRNLALIETSELTILRKYCAACIAQPKLMHKKQQNNEPIMFFIVLRQALVVAWDEVWKSVDLFDTKVARAFWLYSSLFTEPLSLSLVAPGISNGSNLAGVLSELMFTALILFSEKRSDTDRYVEWFEKRCLNPLLLRFADLAVELARSLKQTIAAKLAEESDSVSIIRAFQWWYYTWPLSVRKEADRDLELMKQLRLRPVSFGQMYGMTFMWDELENAVRTALSSGTQREVVTRDLSKVKITAQVLVDDRLAITFVGDDRSFSLADDETQFAFNNPYERLLALRRQRHWIDVSPDKFEEVASALAYIEPASARLDRLHWWQENNANNYYSNLFRQICSDSRVTYSEMLPPSVESLTNHYRIPINYDLETAQLCESALSEEFGKFANLISGLPVSVAVETLSKIASAPAKTFEDLIRTLLCEGTPLSTMQLVKLLGLRSNERRYYILRRRLIRCLLKPEALKEFEAFVRVLRWIRNRFSTLHGFRELTASCKLALVWLHANKLYGLLKAGGQSADWIDKVFRNGVTLVGEDLFEDGEGSFDDSSAQKNVSAERLLLSGIFYCLEPDELRKHSERLVEIGLYTTDGKEFWPKPTMFRMPEQANILNSYTGIDFESLALIVPAFAVLTPSRLHGLVSDGIEEIRKGGQAFLGWLVVGQTLHGADKSEEHALAIRNLVAEKGLRQLVHESESPFATIAVAATYSAQDESLSAKLIEDLKFIASNSEEFMHRSDDAQSKNSEFGLYLSFYQSGAILSRQDGKLQIDKFVDLMIDLADRCPSFGKGLRNILSDLWFEITYEQAAIFWRLRAYLLGL